MSTRSGAEPDAPPSSEGCAISSPAVNDADFAASTAASAGKLLRSVRTDAEARGEDESAIRTLGDAESQSHIAALVTAHRPNDAVLSEEADDDASRLHADRVWIIDPLDGTREYAEGRADWAVHVALWESGNLVAGAVAIPDEDLVLSAADTTGHPDRESGPLRIAVSRTRPPALVEDVARQLDAELVPMGSAGVKISAVVRGRADAYIHAGGQYEWDSAAPVAIARAAGLHTSRIDGRDLEYNQPSPYLPDLVVCRPEFASEVMGAIARTSSANEEANAQ